MSSEKNMRQRVVRILRPLHAVSIENGAGAGTPDVNYVEGWLELKSVERWPPRDGILPVDHFTPQQRLWLRKRSLAKGNAHMLLKVADDWLLIDGWDAAVHVGKAAKNLLLDISVKSWLGGLDEKELLKCLRKT